MSNVIHLCHGTDFQSAHSICRDGIDLGFSSRSLDFGPAFYTAPSSSKLYIKQWALRKAFLSKAAIVNIELKNDFSGLRVLDFRNFNFDDVESRFHWAQFIINNRCGLEYINSVGYKDNNLHQQYDLVIGPIADGRIVKIAKLCKAEKREISRLEINDVIAKDFGIQFAFSSYAAVRRLVVKIDMELLK